MALSDHRPPPLQEKIHQHEWEHIILLLSSQRCVRLVLRHQRLVLAAM